MNNKKKNIINEMIISCVHLGHKKKLLSRDMEPYVLNTNSEISILDLEKTFFLLKNVINIINDIVKNNKIILFICNKNNFKKIITPIAKFLNMPYVEKR